jgi:nitroimidazol reductase NimA-like FMN-containing flavoprotein (pyridoxamine 5'-phosphate oxidase superfamily)
MPDDSGMSDDLTAVVRGIVDENAYMTLATADETGRPWPSPVWFAAEGYGDYYWVSTLETRHSRNLRARPELGIVIFDSRVPPGTGQALYMEATARELEGGELEAGIEVFSRVSEERLGPAWSLEEVVAPAAHRLYRATATRHFALDKDVRSRDERTVVYP